VLVVWLQKGGGGEEGNLVLYTSYISREWEEDDKWEQTVLSHFSTEKKGGGKRKFVIRERPLTECSMSLSPLMSDRRKGKGEEEKGKGACAVLCRPEEKGEKRRRQAASFFLCRKLGEKKRKGGGKKGPGACHFSSIRGGRESTGREPGNLAPSPVSGFRTSEKRKGENRLYPQC